MSKYLVLLLLIFSCDFTPSLYKRILVAQKYITQQRYEKALEEYQSILKQNPPNEIKIKVFYQVGEIYSINLGQHKKSIESFSMVKKLSKDPLWLVRSEEKIADINFNYVKDFESCIKSYKNLLSFKPKLKNYEYYQFQLALSYYKGNQYEQSINVFKEIINDQGQEYYIKSLYFVGLIYFQRKEWKKAISYWNEYVRKETRKDNVVQTKFLIANAYETIEELKQAYNIYYSLLGDYPNTEVLQNRLKSIYDRRIARKR